ncbi:hypothetical protein BCV71DRAFT_14184 [Rhizopus microsporus]|uniref:Uncharacterized protein n=1 Tax=Rhizopus microsporus TaxID=58291 RepID=A0A1X0RXB5_RHIZD|nr:hypothetical protein BCV71DRAFT_14184 [Rhizopus microsporus]
MTSYQNMSSDLHATNRNGVTLTRDDLLMLAQAEYARQLCKYTKAQLEQKIPNHTSIHQSLSSTTSSSSSSSS